MTTSKPYRIVLFKKEDCEPCAQALANLHKALNAHPDFHDYVAVLQKENHPALVVSYNLNLYPTAIIFDEDSEELARKVGVRYLSEDWWVLALSYIHKNRRSK